MTCVWNRTSVRLVLSAIELKPCKKQNKSIYLINKTRKVTKY